MMISQQKHTVKPCTSLHLYVRNISPPHSRPCNTEKLPWAFDMSIIHTCYVSVYFPLFFNDSIYVVTYYITYIQSFVFLLQVRTITLVTNQLSTLHKHISSLNKVWNFQTQSLSQNVQQDKSVLITLSKSPGAQVNTFIIISFRIWRWRWSR